MPAMPHPGQVYITASWSWTVPHSTQRRPVTWGRRIRGFSVGGEPAAGLSRRGARAELNVFNSAPAARSRGGAGGVLRVVEQERRVGVALPVVVLGVARPGAARGGVDDQRVDRRPA